MGNEQTREELLELLETAERRLAEANERWEKLRAKVVETLTGVAKRAECARLEAAKAVENLLQTELIKSGENQSLSNLVVSKVDEARRAYAIYDAIRSVKLWTDGYL